MKVLLINGSPHKEGNTYLGLCEVAKALNEDGIDTEILHVGSRPITGCTGCGVCSQLGKCMYDTDPVNEALEKMKESDGLVVGSPVHYAAASGQITSFLDRFFYAGSGFALKPGAAIVCARRGGTTAALDQLNKYFTISQMPIVSSQYWNMIHGLSHEDVKQDLEGMQTMRVLGHNMAWMLKCIEAGKNAGIVAPVMEAREHTNFVS
ncbi:MAG: flavodoxin family protein [Hespellia sp.]|nr:flavodoxin family protein [Hespellia sp.]